jgi:hypothetical protein
MLLFSDKRRKEFLILGQGGFFFPIVDEGGSLWKRFIVIILESQMRLFYPLTELSGKG